MKIVPVSDEVHVRLWIHEILIILCLAAGLNECRQVTLNLAKSLAMNDIRRNRICLMC